MSCARDVSVSRCDQHLSVYVYINGNFFYSSYHFADYRPTIMEHWDHNYYYEANAASINLRQITSSAVNACTLQRLRDGDDNLNHLYLGIEGSILEFAIREGDDLGWLGYFNGKSQCVQRLYICYLPDGEQQIHAIVEGIAHSQSIRNIGINNLNNDAFT